MDKNYRFTHPFLHFGILSFIYGVGLLTLFSHTLFHGAHTHAHEALDNAKTVASVLPCPSGPEHSYRLTFTARGIVPDHVTAKRCDSLTVVNNTNDEVIAALGPHEHHIHYPGFEERQLAHGQTYTFRLVQAGSFPLHDHDNEGLRANLIVQD